MKQIPDEFLDSMRQVPIEDIASLYFDLKPMGNIYQTKCKHLGDNEPSLTFFKQTNTFYCFGCGAGKRPKTEGSDIISFVMWMDDCTFTEAVHKIALAQGMTVPKAQLSAKDKQKQELIAKTMHQNRLAWEWLQTEERALSYLAERYIKKEEVDKWRIGFIPEQSPQYHQGKIVFALMNDWGQTIGFSYRDMSKEFRGEKLTGPKYINSPKSVIFDKGRTLYGLNFVKRKIREKGYAIVGEGFGDTILGQKLGLPFVSIMGTSLTNEHIAILKQYTDTIILWMDGDNGGINASIRHAKALRKEGFIVKAINFDNKDPDDIFGEMLDFVENQDKTIEEACDHAEDFVLHNAVLASQFEADRVLHHYESQISELKMKALREIIPVLEEIDSLPERAISKGNVARRLGIEPKDLGWEEPTTK